MKTIQGLKDIPQIGNLSILDAFDVDVDNQIEFAKETLTSNTEMIRNYDNKTAIVLSGVSIFFAIIFTNEGIEKILAIVGACISKNTCLDKIYFSILAISVIAIIAGLLFLVLVIIARVNIEIVSFNGIHKKDSRIFFLGISKNKSLAEYKEKFVTMTKNGYLDELLEQIYINSKIASVKHKNYNRGLLLVGYGLAVFIFVIVIGIKIY